MALTFTEGGESRANLAVGNVQMFCKIQPAASDYPTGGYAMYSAAGSAPNNAGQYFGFGFLHGLVPIKYTGTALNYIWLYNGTSCKLQVYSAPGTEVGNGTDLSGGSVVLLAFGF